MLPFLAVAVQVETTTLVDTVPRNEGVLVGPAGGR